jgi:hypothetical protein
MRRASALLALAIVVVFGFLGFQAADPLYDAAARTACSTYAQDHGLELIQANGMPSGRSGFRSFHDYSCGFADPTGATVFVDENDELIEPTWAYRGLRVAGWLSWVVGLALGVGLAWFLGLLHRD